MKHILNNISQEEKNRILEQHRGGKSIDTTRFKALLESTMGNVKPLISEQDGVTTQTTTLAPTTDQTTGQTSNYDKNYFTTKKTGTVSFDNYGFPVTVDGVEITDYDTQWKNNFSVKNIGGRGFQGGDFTWSYGDTVPTGVMGPNENKPGISVKDKSGQEVGTLIF
jgi:preprotein translocase subunit SecD